MWWALNSICVNRLVTCRPSTKRSAGTCSSFRCVSFVCSGVHSKWTPDEWAKTNIFAANAAGRSPKIVLHSGCACVCVWYGRWECHWQRACYISEQLHGLTGFLVFFSTARTASWNTSSRLSLFMAEHSMNCWALILLRIRLPSAVVMNFSECGTRRSLFVPGKLAAHKKTEGIIGLVSGNGKKRQITICQTIAMFITNENDRNARREMPNLWIPLGQNVFERGSCRYWIAYQETVRLQKSHFGIDRLVAIDKVAVYLYFNWWNTHIWVAQRSQALVIFLTCWGKKSTKISNIFRSINSVKVTRRQTYRLCPTMWLRILFDRPSTCTHDYRTLSAHIPWGIGFVCRWWANMFCLQIRRYTNKPNEEGVNLFPNW